MPRPGTGSVNSWVLRGSQSMESMGPKMPQKQIPNAMGHRGGHTHLSSRK